MQSISANLKAALIDIDARVTPRTLVDLFELYDYDATPDASGFDPADAIETFAAQEITWNGIAYRREAISRGDILRNMGEKTNSVTLSFSNISRYLATLAQSQEMEGLLLVIRCVVPSVTDDSIVLFVGRCDKPSDIDKKTFTISARQDFGNINQTLPPRKFTAEDPEGRLPNDPLYEGIQFTAIQGSYAYPQVVPATGFFGRLFGQRDTKRVTEQYSSIDNTPYGSVIREIFGRCQVELIPFVVVDKGIYLAALWAVSNGPISAVENIKTRAQGLSDPINSFATPPAPAVVHLGDPGGTGTNQGNTAHVDLGGGQKFSHLAYIEGVIIPLQYFTDPSLSDPNVLNELPPVTALVKGRRVPLPDSGGVYTDEGWSDNPVHIARFILTDPNFVGIDEAFMEDAVNYLTSLHCDEPLLDDTNDEIIVVGNPELPQTGGMIIRYRSTGILTSRFIRFNEFGELTPQELEDGPYVGVDFDETPLFATQRLLRKRYTFSATISEEVRAVDYLYKTVFPSFKGFLRVNKRGKYELRSEVSSDATYLRSATAVGATSVPVLDVTPWKSGPDLLLGRLLLGSGLTTSEVRDISSADYSTSGNSVSLAASASGGGVTATASGATLSGGSTSAQASGTITVGGSPAAGNSITVTIDGIAVTYVLDITDNVNSAAAMLAHHINANQRLRQHIRAYWDSATPTVVTIKCLHGALNVSSALLKTHSGPIADPTTAPTAAGASGGSLPAGTYELAYANANATGSTVLTARAQITVTANQKIDVSGLPALPAGITSRNFYLSERAGSSNLRLAATRTDASNFSISAVPNPGAALPPSKNTTAEELLRVAMSFATNSQDVYPAWRSSFTVPLNDIYLPTTPNGHKYQATSITTGITGTTEPTWPTSAGGTVVDSGVTWTEIGSTVLQQAGLTRANIIKDSFKWPLGSRQSSVNQVKGSFRDAKNDFALTPVRVNDPTHQAQVKKIYPLEFDGSGIDNQHQFMRVANWLLSKNREGDWFDSLGTGPQGLVLEEGDVICASDDSGGLINVVTRIEDLRIKPNHEVVINQARKYSTLMFSDDVGSHNIPVASTLRFTQTLDSVAEFIDSFAIRDADALVPGFYIAVSRSLDDLGDWKGWTLYADYGDGYKPIAKGDVPAFIGECTTTLGTPSDPYVLDETSSVTFTLNFGDDDEAVLTNATLDDLLANPRKNLFLIGDEYVQAMTIVSNGSRSYTISDLLRGRFYTDGDELTHGASERVVYLNGAEVLVKADLSILNKTYNYKVVTTNQDVADATAIPFTWTGGTAKLPSVKNIKGTRDSEDDLLIEFYGRTRIGGGVRSYQGGATNEEEVVYKVQILNSGSTTLPSGNERILTVIPGTQLAAVLISSRGSFVDITHNSLVGSVTAPAVAAASIQQIHEAGNFLEGTLQLDTSGGSPVAIGIQKVGRVWKTLSIDIATVVDDSTLTGNLATFPYLVMLESTGGGPFFQIFSVYEYGTRIFRATDDSGDPDYDPDFGWTAVTAGFAIFRVKFNFVGSTVRIQKTHVTNVPFTTIAVGTRPAEFPVFGVASAFASPEDKMLGMVMTCNPFPKTIYGASQQSEDGFTPGNPIQMDIWQESNLIGKGAVRRIVL